MECLDHEVEYCVKHDADYCKVCDKWLEPECKCGEGECQFKGRPDKPSEVKRDVQ